MLSNKYFKSCNHDYAVVKNNKDFNFNHISIYILLDLYCQLKIMVKNMKITNNGNTRDEAGS